MKRILKTITLCVCFMLCLNVVCAVEKLKLSDVTQQTQTDNIWHIYWSPITAFAITSIGVSTAALLSELTLGQIVLGMFFTTTSAANLGVTVAEGAATGPIGWIVIGVILAATFFASGAVKTYMNQTIEYGCETWEAPEIGDCEICNKGDVPCTQYKCDSLGHQCSWDSASNLCLLNLTTDTVPPVITFNSSKSNGYECKSYENNKGCNITNPDGKNTLSSSTSFVFGVSTDEWAKCKYTLNNVNGTYKSFRSSALYNTNFYETFDPINIDSLNQQEGIDIDPDAQIDIYVRCSDVSGNTREPYKISFKFDPLPDVTDPKYEYSSYITQNICVINQTMPIGIILSDASTVSCRWSTSPDSYASMTNDMQCPSIGIGKQLCSTNLTSISVEGTTYYFACNDSMGNYNQQSKNNNVTLRTGSELKIRSVTPTPGSAFYYPLTEMPINITVETMMGCNQGQATCYLKQKNQATNEFPTGDGAMFENTNNISGKSSQLLRLGNGTYTYLITCEDEAGHTTNTTTNFTVNIDTEAPVVARQYTDNNNQLHVITSYNTTCRYTTQEAQGCDFEFNEGLNMSQQGQREHLLNIPDKSKTYYIKCQDQRAVSTDCSATIKYDN